jgi:molecular chaperone DnaK
MPHILGIDLGTTNSCMATLEHGTPRVLENAEGGRTTPSVVAFRDSGERAVGAPARRQAVANPERTIFSIKRFMGRKLSEVSSEQQAVPYSVIAGNNEAVRVLVEGEELAPEQISAQILAKLKADAEAYLGEEVTDSVITVPAYFNDAQRNATKDAATIAGLNVLRIINEPTAAALAYGFNQEEDEEKTLLVFDLGGGTFDVSVMEIADKVFEVKATKGDNHLGGNDFDKLIVDWVAQSFQKEHDIDLAQDPVALQRLYEAAEKAKIELSSASDTDISLPFITSNENGALHLEVKLTRSHYIELAAELLARLEGPTRQAIADAGLTAESLDAVLLVGGMTRMPAIAEVVKNITGKDPLRGVNPDEAVAIGAALQAGVQTGEINDVLLLDVIPLSLGIETKGGIFTKLVEANTTIPMSITESFTTAEDNQPSVEVHVLQGEREMAHANRSLGRVVLLGIPPARAGTPQIEVTFKISTDGILSVTAHDLGTNMQKETTIKESTGLSSDEVDRMRMEASQYADEDRAQRQFAEMRNRTETLRDSARRTLREHGDKMSREDREAVESAVVSLDSVLSDAATDITALEQVQEMLTATMDRFAAKLYSTPTTPHRPEDADGEQPEVELAYVADEEEFEYDYDENYDDAPAPNLYEEDVESDDATVVEADSDSDNA